MIDGNSALEITRYHQKPESKILEIYDWAGHSHFDGTEYGLEAKLNLLRGKPTNIQNTIEEGYISAKMCVAVQKSIETRSIVNLNI